MLGRNGPVRIIWLWFPEKRKKNDKTPKKYGKLLKNKHVLTRQNNSRHCRILCMILFMKKQLLMIYKFHYRAVWICTSHPSYMPASADRLTIFGKVTILQQGSWISRGIQDILAQKIHLVISLDWLLVSTLHNRF